MIGRGLRRFAVVFCAPLILMGSCHPPQRGVHPATTEASIPVIPHPTLSPTALPKLLEPTPMISATNTAPPSPTIVAPTPTPLPPTITPQVPTATPRPTLSPAEEEVYSLAQLSTNGRCSLPCWWGIQPGTTTVSQTTALDTLGFQPLPYSPRVVEYNFLITTDKQSNSTLNIVVAVEKDIVQRISLSTEDLAEAPRLANALQPYSPHQILTVLGTPSRAFIGLKSGPTEANAPWLYQVWMFYDDKGLVTYYEGEGMSRKGDILKVCPTSVGVRWMKLDIVASSDDHRWMEVEKRIQSDTSEGYVLPLEKALGKKLAEFRSAIVADSNACFESPVSLW
jgi:hypothetical protein